MTTKHLIKRVVGNTGPDLFSEYEGVDLSTLTSITVDVRDSQGGLVSKPMVIDDAPAGLFHIVWDPGDLVEGDYSLEYVIIDGSGNIMRLPNNDTILLEVRAQV